MPKDDYDWEGIERLRGQAQRLSITVSLLSLCIAILVAAILREPLVILAGIIVGLVSVFVVGFVFDVFLISPKEPPSMMD